MSTEQGLIRALRLPPPADDDGPRDGFPWQLPVVAALQGAGLALHPAVTYLVGENGSGKSTLLEALAVAAGMNPEGGSSNFDITTDPHDRHVYSERDPHLRLGEALTLVRGAAAGGTDFFLRADTVFTTARYLEETSPAALDSYGGISLHGQSHGESFLAVMLNRFGPGGLYLLDEPEAALSAQNCLTCVRRIHELVAEGSQFVIATHSPLVLAYPDAVIYELSADGVEEIDYEQAEPVRLTTTFLADRERFLETLLTD